MDGDEAHTHTHRVEANHEDAQVLLLQTEKALHPCRKSADAPAHRGANVAGVGGRSSTPEMLLGSAGVGGGRSSTPEMLLESW